MHDTTELNPPQVVRTSTGHQPAPHVLCCACGVYKHISLVKPADTVDGHVLRWICLRCDAKARGDKSVRGWPAIGWTTIARAERLQHLGAGGSVDHVLRQALALLEQQALGSEARA